jgi:hypothetical protein
MPGRRALLTVRAFCIIGSVREDIMFWIICLVIFVLLCAGLTLLVRSRGGGSGLGSGVDNHNAVQNGTARANARRNQGSGPFGPGI